MAFGSIPHLKLTSNYLNAINDAAPGVPLASPSGSIVQDYKGQLGGLVTLSAREAAKRSYTTTGTLYEGVYQYVQFLAGTTAAPTRGFPVAWSDYDDFVVTPDLTATNCGHLAGICLMSNTKGYYGFIQVAGRAGVLMHSSITKATPADGDLVVLQAATVNAGDVLADATGLTSLTYKMEIGRACATPVASTVILVQLKLALNMGPSANAF